MSPATRLTIEAQLLELFGPLLTPDNLATVLHRKPGGMKAALQTPGAVKDLFEDARLPIGRRVYYRASDVAEVLAGSSD